MIAICTFGLLYVGGAFYYKDKFFKGTKINGVSCDNLTAKEAEKKIEDKIEDYSLEIAFKDGEKEVIDGKEIDYEYLSDGKIQEYMKKQNPFLWTSGFFRQYDYEVGEGIVFDETKLQKKLNTFACMQDANMVPPKDAYIVFENNNFVIKPEELGSTLDKALLTEKIVASVKAGQNTFSAEEADIYMRPAVTSEDEALEELGSTLDKALLTEKIVASVKAGQNTFSAEEADIYMRPAVTSEDEALEHQQEVWNGCAAVTVTYTFGDKKEVLDGMTVKDWMTYDENGNYVENLGVLQQHIRDYVQMDDL